MKRNLLIVAVTAMAVVSIGCAITDYDGIGSHKTTGDAKLWGKDIAFSGFGSASDGTYSYVVSYDNTGQGNGGNRINSLRNTVVGSFTRDGLVDQDGNDVQGGGGTLGGKFLPWVVSVDFEDGVCGFDANITQDKSGTNEDGSPGLQVLLCINGSNEEVDRDAELHAQFGSVDGLLSSIWSGALKGEFSLDINGIKINGVSYPTDVASISALAAPMRPAQFSIANSPGWGSVIQTILDKTEHMQPVSIGLSFAGGMVVDLPTSMTVAFNHDALWGAL